MSHPYTNLEVTEHYVLRKFDKDVDVQELYWHRDDEDRTVEVVECGEGWQFQHDNKLPLYLSEGDTIFIQRHDWHRVLKGSGDLIIKIYKHGKEEN